MYRLDYVSPFTVYEVGRYETVTLAEQDARRRFDSDWIIFTQGDDGVYRMTLSFEDNVMLELYEIEE